MGMFTSIICHLALFCHSNWNPDLRCTGYIEHGWFFTAMCYLSWHCKLWFLLHIFPLATDTHSSWQLDPWYTTMCHLILVNTDSLTNQLFFSGHLVDNYVSSCVNTNTMDCKSVSGFWFWVHFRCLYNQI